MACPIGEKFGRLLVITKGNRVGYALCQCDCGNQHEAYNADLRQGKTRSCGCLLRERTIERSKTHGMRHTPEYEVWKTMRARCGNPRTKGYERYGGRGIKVCERWHGPDGFMNFLADIGPRPEGRGPTGRALYSIDRFPDPDGDYEPGNVRWATDSEQAFNRSKPSVPRRARLAK